MLDLHWDIEQAKKIIRQKSAAISLPISQIGRVRHREVALVSEAHILTEKWMKNRAGSSRALAWPPVLWSPEGWSEGGQPLDGQGGPSDPTSHVTQRHSALGAFYSEGFFLPCRYLVLFYGQLQLVLGKSKEEDICGWHLAQEMGGTCENEEAGRPR